MASTKEKCYVCLYWKIGPYPDDQKDGRGYCRKNAPIVTSDVSQSRFPLVSLTDWCGEFRLKCTE